MDFAKRILEEDAKYFDITTLGLGIEKRQGVMHYAPKNEIILSGLEIAKEICALCNLETKIYASEGENLQKETPIMEARGNALQMHKAWKISQNIFEYMSGIATHTHKLLTKAQSANPDIKIALTRKNFPGTKEVMLQAVIHGGGVPHRLGLYDSVLVFQEHRTFFSDEKAFESAFKNLKKTYFEKKIAVEVANKEEARYFAALGADILQCEKMDFASLKECVSLKNEYPTLLLSATGGITLENIDKYAACGVDFIVTSSPYHAKPADIKVWMEYVG